LRLRRKLAGAALAVLPVLAASSPAAAQARDAAASPGSARLAILVSGLPPGVAAKVDVRGPRMSKRVRKSQVLPRVRPGRYTFIVRQVTLRGGLKRIPAGSRATPVRRLVRIRVKRGQKAQVRVTYGTIINGNARRLDARPLSVQGSPVNPAGLVLPGAVRARVGTILTAELSSKLPGGLFHRVTAVLRSPGRLTVRLKRARLAEVFPQLDLKTRLDLFPDAGRRARPRAAGGAEELDPPVVSVGAGNLRCQVGVRLPIVSVKARLDGHADIDLHMPWEPDSQSVLPYGRMAVTFRGTGSADVRIPKNSGCSLSKMTEPRYRIILIAGLPTPFYFQVGIAGALQAAEDMIVRDQLEFTLTGGINFHGLLVVPFGSLVPRRGQTVISGAGKLAVGPALRIASGIAGAVDVHFDVSAPYLQWVQPLTGPCKLDITADVQIGLSLLEYELNQPVPFPTWDPPLYTCPVAPPPPPPPPVGPVGPAALDIAQEGPAGAFQNQEFEYKIRVRNTGGVTAQNVEVVDTLPSEGSFVSSAPNGSPDDPAPGDHYTIRLGNLGPGASKSVALAWRAPAADGDVINRAIAQASNTEPDGPAIATVTVGPKTNCNPCGADAAGTGLRNRDHGTIEIDGIPRNATVSRAVLVWATAKDRGPIPSSTIMFDDHPVSADVSTFSGLLCQGDVGSFGYSADVTKYVAGNGTYTVSDPPRGETRVDDEPGGALPNTDGASLVVFYVGGGARNQVRADFSYNTNYGDGLSGNPNDDGRSIRRAFGGLNSIGGSASLILIGPGGQADGAETFTLTGDGTRVLRNTFDGSDPQDRPDFRIGNFWDTDRHDVSDILPRGQETLHLDHEYSGTDCIGLSAAVLQVSQR